MQGSGFQLNRSALPTKPPSAQTHGLKSLVGRVTEIGNNVTPHFPCFHHPVMIFGFNIGDCACVRHLRRWQGDWGKFEMQDNSCPTMKFVC